MPSLGLFRRFIEKGYTAMRREPAFCALCGKKRGQGPRLRAPPNVMCSFCAVCHNGQATPKYRYVSMSYKVSAASPCAQRADQMEKELSVSNPETLRLYASILRKPTRHSASCSGRPPYTRSPLQDPGEIILAAANALEFQAMVIESLEHLAARPAAAPSTPPDALTV